MIWKSGIVEQRVMCERERCHGGETRFFFFHVTTFAPNALPQPLQNLTVKLAVDSLTRGYEFLVDNALDAKKTINMDLTLL
jgi:hypothetical protein